PVKDAFGQTTVTIRLKDAVTAVVQDVNLNWTPVNDAPTVPVVKGPVDGAQDVPLSTPLAWEATDVDMDALVYDVSLGLADEPLVVVSTGQQASIFNALGLDPGQHYNWQVVVRDPHGASAQQLASFTTEADKQPPVVSAVSPTSGETGVTVVWTTDELSDGQLRYQSDPDPLTSVIDSGEQVLTTGLTLNHALTLQPQHTAAWYTFEVRSQDAFGNVSDWVSGRFFVPAAPDTDPPIIAPGTLASNGATETSIWITWSTNELSNSIVRYVVDTAPAAGKLAQDLKEVVVPTLARAHSVQLTGLTAATAYRYTALSVDESNNESIGRDGLFTTAREKDGTPPGFTDGPGVQPPKVESAEIVVGTDETTTAQVRYRAQDDVDAQVNVAASLDPKTRHTIALLGLTAGTRYQYSVRIEDESANVTESGLLSFSTRNLPDLVAPVIEGIGVNPQALSAVLRLRTNEPSLLSLSWWPVAEPTLIAFTDVSVPASAHALTMENLQAATDYQYELRVKDEAINELAPVTGDFSTAEVPDVVPPTVLNSFVDNQRLESTFLEVEVNELGRLSAVLVLLEVASVQPRSGSLAQVPVEGRQINGANLGKKHRLPLTSLAPGATYRIDYVVLDASNNKTTGAVEFTAARQADTEPPQPMSWPGIEGITDMGARLVASYNEDVRFEVRYWLVDDPLNAELRSVTVPARGLTIGLSPLLAAKTYVVGVTARDGAGLVHEAELNFTTLAGADLTPPVFAKLPWQDDAQATSARLRMVLSEPVTGEATFSDADGNTRSVSIY
ncbi:MAG: fibronectin type III domain-containing protein, partial [Gemmatimonadetes bacterium]|nr:fibronectin type III domain-containing protein [Gemmatimonadota bacterium]